MDDGPFIQTWQHLLEFQAGGPWRWTEKTEEQGAQEERRNMQ